ncbi:alpha/beta fold hydrolase [Costertonia aggregata]|uniref:Alpha/beta hydrolase n=1 Tax=Costertonia aggregata TaxID=343403 RepID=A0A7H9ART6_9FLAO|nr:alpha/beta hydrolase [Costertonia aggregata]QLG46136.1 alpha/beta hydrolase [Costertonia aggregata]
MKRLINRLLPKLYGTYLNMLSLFSKDMAANKAFHVFCTIRKGKVLPVQKEFLDTAKDKVHTIENHKIQSYRWQGSKETVLLVHGWESNVFRWRNLIKKLKEADFNIIAFDAPGHGYSSGKYLYVPLYEKALQSMIEIYEPKYLIGHSVGGMTIMYNQYLHPQSKVDKLVTIGAPSEFHELMTHYENLLGLNKRVLNGLEAYIKNRFGFTFKEFSTASFALKNTKKGILFHDSSDPITPYHNSVAVHKNWKGSQLVTTKGLGHSMHQDDVNDKIIRFLKS